MKSIAKRLARGVALACVALPVACYLLARGLVGRQHAFCGISQAFSLLPGLGGVYLRHALYRLVLPECGADAWIGFGTVFSHPDARVGRQAYLGVGCMIGDVTIGDDVLIGSHVSIVNGNRQHGIERLDIPIREQPGEYPRVTIGADSWIGDRAIVMADIGRQCVVGAGSVVTRPVPDYAIAVGNPARVVRLRVETQDTSAADGDPARA